MANRKHKNIRRHNERPKHGRRVRWQLWWESEMVFDDLFGSSPEEPLWHWILTEEFLSGTTSFASAEELKKAFREQYPYPAGWEPFDEFVVRNTRFPGAAEMLTWGLVVWMAERNQHSRDRRAQCIASFLSRQAGADEAVSERSVALT